jgi:hypothetical protein
MGADVFLLGAGFSKAVGQEMPTQDELGSELRSALGADADLPPNFEARDFERWLTYLADDQPWRTERENLRARAAFLKVTELLREVLTTRERTVRLRPPPGWLTKLVTAWHRERATVITLNYDLLVEAAFTECVKPDFGGQSEQNYLWHAQIYPAPMTPTPARRGAGLIAPHIDTFQLLKLHGSRNWVYSGRAEFFGETIYDDSAIRSWSPSPDDTLGGAPDKVPLIVPPTASKSSFFRNETVRGIWRAALGALREASRVYCVGYSMPPADLTMASMLVAGTGPGKTVLPVDIAAAVLAHYEQALPQTTVSPAFIGPNAVEQLADQWPG